MGEITGLEQFGLLAYTVAEEVEGFDDRVPDSGVPVIFYVEECGLLAV
jgi:hypothetical protein